VWNNLAVACEATGDYDGALKNYRRALELAPQDQQIKRNYSRFVEFYQSFKPKKDEADKAAPAKPETTEPKPPGDDGR
jgi:Tfp pilus assembly protein PilF